MDEQWQADLVDVQALKGENDGFRYLLTVIDILSKYAWVVPLKDKTGKSLVDAFDHIFKEDGRVPERLQTDKGSEFTNRQFQKFLESKHVQHFVTYSDTKAQIVERFNRTIKTRMWRYFTEANHYRYLDVLDNLMKSYNSSTHRSIGTAPDRVTQENAQEIWHYLYGDDFVKRVERMRYKFKVGDQVRIAKAQGVFAKGYTPNWTEEVFTIARRNRTTVPTYRLKEYDGTMLKGMFYEAELERVQSKESDFFKIEKILDTRGSGRRKEYLVKWRGWPSKYDQWIPASYVKDV